MFLKKLKILTCEVVCLLFYGLPYVDSAFLDFETFYHKLDKSMIVAS